MTKQKLKEATVTLTIPSNILLLTLRPHSYWFPCLYDVALPLVFTFVLFLCPKTSSLLMLDKGYLVYRIIIICLTKYDC